MNSQKESHLRSLLKATSWRVLATLTTGLIAYFITGEVDTAVTIGSIEFVLKFAIYYGHERVWQLVPRGSVRELLVQPDPGLPTSPNIASKKKASPLDPSKIQLLTPNTGRACL